MCGVCLLEGCEGIERRGGEKRYYIIMLFVALSEYS